MNLEEIQKHRNVEKVIRYYLSFLPPRGSESILNIGAGVTDPYGGMLKTRCKTYASLDIRPSPLGITDYVGDMTKTLPFEDKSWEWIFCSETMEHIPNDLERKAVDECMRIANFAVFTFPTPLHESFYGDDGHIEVKLNFPAMDLVEDKYKVYDKSSSTGRAVFIVSDKSRKLKIKHPQGIKYED